MLFCFNYTIKQASCQVRGADTCYDHSRGIRQQYLYPMYHLFLQSYTYSFEEVLAVSRIKYRMIGRFSERVVLHHMHRQLP